MKAGVRHHHLHLKPVKRKPREDIDGATGAGKSFEIEEKIIENILSSRQQIRWI